MYQMFLFQYIKYSHYQLLVEFKGVGSSVVLNMAVYQEERNVLF